MSLIKLISFYAYFNKHTEISSCDKPKFSCDKYLIKLFIQTRLLKAIEALVCLTRKPIHICVGGGWARQSALVLC